jgi:hypothetical protein
MGVLLRITQEYFGASIRDEDGIIFEIGGKKYIIKYEDYKFIKNIVPIGDNGEYFMEMKSDIFEEPTYLCKIKVNSIYSDITYDYYYITKSVLDEVEKNTIEDGLVMWITSSYDVFSDDFLIVKILKEVKDEFDEIEFTEEIDISSRTNYYNVENNRLSIKIYSNRDNAVKDAKEDIYNILNDDYKKNMTKDEVANLRKTNGDDWLDINGLKDFFEEDYKENYDNKRYTQGEHGSELNDELIDKNLIEDNDSYFDVDKENPKFDIDDYKDELISCVMKYEDLSKEEATKTVENYTTSEYIDALIDFNIVEENDKNFELDYDSPKFNEEDMIEELVKKMLKDIDDVVDEYIFNFDNLPEDYYNLEKLAEIMVELNGVATQLASQDSEEHIARIDGKTYFVYIS